MLWSRDQTVPGMEAEECGVCGAEARNNTAMSCLDYDNRDGAGCVKATRISSLGEESLL